MEIFQKNLIKNSKKKYMWKNILFRTITENKFLGLAILKIHQWQLGHDHFRAASEAYN